MSYRCSIYNLGVIANRTIPGVPSSSIDSIDLRISFGELPARFRELDDRHRQLSYTSEYTDSAGEPLLHVYRLLDGTYHYFRYADRTEFLVDNAGTEIWSCWQEPLTIEDAATYLLGPVLGFVLLLRGVVCLHASAVVVDSEAIALIGPAGSGKSTTAAAFSSKGFSILADDVVTLDDRVDRFLVRPSYPCIRLWPASVKALYGTESYLPRLTPNWDKCYLDLTNRPDQFERGPLPLAAVYVLGERSDDAGAPFVTPLDSANALLSLIANTYTNYLMHKEMQARQFDLLTRVLAGVPVRKVTPHADAGRLQKLCDCIFSDFASLKLKPRWSKGQDSHRAVHV
ncbi:MAG TPA: hypothetical protein VFO99_01040 [Pyrinomonadaceae bacterium]|nr:hypothetical protein [Pyrinomonadaceae bacterium]